MLSNYLSEIRECRLKIIAAFPRRSFIGFLGKVFERERQVIVGRAFTYYGQVDQLQLDDTRRVFLWPLQMEKMRLGSTRMLSAEVAAEKRRVKMMKVNVRQREEGISG